MENKKNERLERILAFIYRYWAMLFVAVFIFGCILFLFAFGDNIYVSANDTLDSNISYYKFKRDTWYQNKNTNEFISPLLGGAPGTERLFSTKIINNIGFVTLVYLLCPPFEAYIVCFFARMILGIIGWIAVAYALYGKEKISSIFNYIVIIGFTYGILPVWPMAMALTALPLVLAVCILSYKKNSIVISMLLCLFPVIFGGGLALYGIFLLFFLFVFLLVDVFIHKKISRGILACICVLVVVYLFQEGGMIKNVVGNGTIRTGFTDVSEFDFIVFFKSIINYLKCGRYHCGTNQQFFVFPICAIYFVVSNGYAFYKGKSKKEILFKPYNIVFGWFLLNGVLAAIGTDMAIMQYIYLIVPILKALSLQRFIFYNPLALYLCIMFIVVDILKEKKYVLAHMVIWLSLVAVIWGQPSSSSVVMYNDIGRNIKYNLLGQKIGYPKLTWHEIVSEELFRIIKEDINYQGEWCVAYGFLPSVLNYNGIYTLDGYDSGYSPEYKEKFSELIAPYIQMGGAEADYFNNYGIRAYIFSDDVGYMPENYTEVDEAPMYINPAAFRNMGGKYVFSITQITNSNELGLRLCGVYTYDDSPYHMHVYTVDEEVSV